MRSQLNLNKYCDGLEDSQINELFRLCTDTKLRAQDVKLLVCESEDSNSMIFQISRLHFIASLLVIDDFLESCGKAPIFEIAKLRDAAGGNLKGIDEFPLIEQFDYLMEESA